MDMREGTLWDKICLFALPLALSSILQQLFNSADTAVAGKFASSQAMAAVGSNASLISLLVNLFVGLSVGANVLIASYIGQDKKDDVNKAVHTVMSVALISGVVMMIVGQFVARPALEAISSPDDVIGMATQYLRLYFIGMPFIMVYNFGSAILRAVGDSKRPLFCLVCSGVVNVCLNLYFVIVWHMAAAGVGLATTISNAVSASLVLWFLTHEEGELKLNLKKLSLDKKYLSQMVRIGGPAGLQGMVFSLSNVIIQSGINSFGSDVVAGLSAGQNFEFFCYYVVSGFSQAAVTFTSQNYAAGKYDRCKKIWHICMGYGLGLTALLSLVFIMFRYQLMGIYSSQPEVIAYGVKRMMWVCSMECLTGTYEITGSCLRGMGCSLLPAIETIIGSCVFRFIYIPTVFAWSHTLDTLLAVYVCSWVITGTTLITTYLIKRKDYLTPKDVAHAHV